jgi:hypothetical protein
MSVISPIARVACPPARAGIATIWAIDCADVSELTFDEDRQITAITLVTATPTKKWKRIDFEKNTAFFNQAKTRARTAVNVAQTISFVEPGMSLVVRNALEDLNGVCCGHFIIKDNSGNYHYAGITFNPVTEEWNSEDMRTGEGSANTNTDPVADQAEYVETLVANVGFYAPFWSLGESGIVV